MKPKLPKARNWYAVAAHNRKAGPMQDRRLRRQGKIEAQQIQEQLDLMDPEVE